MTKRKAKQPAGAVCHDGKRCKGTHPLICRDHGCGILVGRAAAAESKALATNAERVRSSAWVAELEAALTHAERAMAGAMKALDFRVWDEIEDSVDCLRAAVESNRRRSATAHFSDPAL
jgi:hypothetical protein